MATALKASPTAPKPEVKQQLSWSFLVKKAVNWFDFQLWYYLSKQIAPKQRKTQSSEEEGTFQIPH